MFKKRLAIKCLAFGLALSVAFGGMSGITVEAQDSMAAERMAGTKESTGAAGGEEAGAAGATELTDVPEEIWEAGDECTSGLVAEEAQEYGELLEVSEKDGGSEDTARARKEEKAAEKAAAKAEKEAEKADKEEQKEERKLAKKFDKEKHEKTSKINSVEDHEEFWNIVSVGSEEGGIRTIGEDAAVLDPVKVAILDSGVDYTEDIDVYMRKNFIPGEDEISVIYEDISGHGTSVAGIIAAKDNDEGITGINPYVQLYSARILDENKQAPASRVVAAIDWAIGQDVDIINISFGTTVDSEEIHAAIRRAYDAGILIVAAAGNNGVVEYPAAYDEVVAVGAVDAKGERTEGSAIGDELELVAPGQQIVSTGAFGGVCVVGGTSLAAPHVTAVASVLWQKDKSVSADFIRSLLAFTANQYGEDYEYGNGLVDLDFALNQFDAFREVYAVDADVLNEQVGEAVADGMLEVNEKPVEEFGDVVYVEGSWAPDKHEALATGTSAVGSLSGSELAIVKLGAVAPDRKFGGMKIHSEWHGYLRHVIQVLDTTDENDEKYKQYILYYSNYVYTYLYVSEIAKAVSEGKSPTNVNHQVKVKCANSSNCPRGSYCVTLMENEINERFYSGGMTTEDTFGNPTGDVTWAALLENKYPVNDKNKSLYIYGLALHIVTDTFSHSSFRQVSSGWKRIVHEAKIENEHLDADNVNCIPGRYACASYMSKLLIEHIIKKDAVTVADYFNLITSSVFTGDFRLGNLSEYINAVDEQYYNLYGITIDRMSYTDPI